MPRIIFITTLTLWSMKAGHGGPAFTRTVQKYLDEGWEVYLISDESSNSADSKLDAQHNIYLKPTCFKRYGQVRKLGLLFRWLDHRIMTRRFCAAAENIIQNDRQDTILYAYEVFGVEACKRLSEKYQIPFVTRFQGTILSGYLGRLKGYQRLARYPHCQALAQPSDLVIMTDDGTLGDIVLKQLSNTSPTLFLRNGLELMAKDVPAMIDAFDREAFRYSLGVAENDIMFLTVSRLVGWKRVERAIDGFAAFLSKGGIGKLVIVGDGDAKTDLMRRTEEQGIAEQVYFSGSVPQSEVYSYMMASDVFLSLYDLSNVGNPLLEAMTLGKCIITLDAGATNEIISDRNNGVLLKMEDLPRLDDVMLELAKDNALRSRLADAAAAYAQEHFYSWERRMNIEFQTIKELLKI